MEFPLERRAGALYMEDVPLASIAERHGTPCYVYSRAAIERGYRAFAAALAGRPALVCYAMKANSNLAILNLFARLGAGFDIVSGGELARVLAAGGDPAKVVFSGVGKTAAEMRQALDAGIRCFNVESAAELDRLAAVARELGRRAPVSIRVNPDVDPQTHPYISTGLRENKFGVPFDTAHALYRRAHASAHLEVVGIDCHIGSQITQIAPYLDALDRLLDLVEAGHFRAATDVFPVEPAPADARARRVEGLLLSAHRAGATPETFATIGEMVVEDLDLLLRGLPAQRLQPARPETVGRWINPPGRTYPPGTKL